MSCSNEFPDCPISLYNLFRIYSETDSSNQLVEENNIENEVTSESPLEQSHFQNKDKWLSSDPKLIEERLHKTDKPFNYWNHLDY